MGLPLRLLRLLRLRYTDNAVNGVPSCASKMLLDENLRGKWGFDGCKGTSMHAGPPSVVAHDRHILLGVTCHQETPPPPDHASADAASGE